MSTFGQKVAPHEIFPRVLEILNLLLSIDVGRDWTCSRLKQPIASQPPLRLFRQLPEGRNSKFWKGAVVIVVYLRD